MPLSIHFALKWIGVYPLASSPGPAQKNCMCWVSILCNSTSATVASYCWHRHYKISKQILPRICKRLILGTEISNLSSKINSKFLNFEIYMQEVWYPRYHFKQSRNGITDFTCNCTGEVCTRSWVVYFSFVHDSLLITTGSPASLKRGSRLANFLSLSPHTRRAFYCQSHSHVSQETQCACGYWKWHQLKLVSPTFTV